MNFKISIEFDTANPEHREALESLLGSGIAVQPARQNEATRDEQTQPETTKESAPAAADEAEASAPVEVVADDPKEGDDDYTLNDVRAKLRRYNELTSLKDATALLTKHGAKNLSGLDAKKYGQVIRECEETIQATK